MVYSPKALWAFAQQIGFSRYSRKLKYHHPNDLHGLQLAYCLSPPDEDSAKFGPRVTAYGCTGPQQKDNRDLIRRRNDPCEKGYDAYCCDCPMSRQQCELACRDQPDYKDICRVCGRIQKHDPRHPRACVVCRSNNIKRRMAELSG